MSNRPVFVHALFRTGSTYLWNKFRQLPGYCCYYEPFHQILANVTPKNVLKALTTDFRQAGHPELERPYWYEFMPLLRDDVIGVPYFRKELSFDWFCWPSGVENPAQKRYVDFLIESAGSRIPLLQFNRTALRTGWFKSAYPDSIHIYLCRNPRDQWQSYSALGARTGYDKFFLMDLIALSKSCGSPLVRPLAAAVPLLNLPSDKYTRDEQFYQLVCRAYSERQKYFMFYYLWLVALLENHGQADTIVNMNALAEDQGYRQLTRGWFMDRAIGGLEFDDCRVTRYDHYAPPGEVLAEVEQEVQSLLAGSSLQQFARLLATRLPVGQLDRIPVTRSSPDASTPESASELEGRRPPSEDSLARREELAAQRNERALCRSLLRTIDADLPGADGAPPGELPRTAKAPSDVPDELRPILQARLNRLQENSF